LFRHRSEDFFCFAQCLPTIIENLGQPAHHKAQNSVRAPPFANLVLAEFNSGFCWKNKWRAYFPGDSEPRLTFATSDGTLRVENLAESGL
jgi:hypothetical protein